MNFSVDLHGQTAIVTGAGADVGRAAARALAAAGAAVAVNDLNPDRADRVAAEISASGGRALAVQADVSNRFQASALIEATRDAFGRVQILINAAGVEKRDPLLKIDEWDWRRVLDVNLTGAFFCSQLIGRVMADEGGGVIVNIAAAVGAAGALEGGAAYVASKAGLVGLTRQCAHEYAPLGIRVNAICPADLRESEAVNGASDRPTAEDVAAVALFLCSDAARSLSGQALIIGV